MSFDKKVHDQINRVERIEKVLKKDQVKMSRYLEQEGDGYLQVENDNEKTLKVSQDYLIGNLPKYNKDNIFNLELSSGPYNIDFSLNGSSLLLAGEKGHVSMIEWRDKNLVCEMNLSDKISSVKFLHNDTMFALGQKKRVYIYDKQGIELHSLDYLANPKFLDFLPHHFLLVSALKNNHIKYLDVSLGKMVSEIKTKSGEISSMSQNPSNAVIITGHSNGCVNMWTPNFASDPVIKILCHPSSVTGLCVDPSGTCLTTIGSDSKMKVYDLRNTYSCLYEYFNPLPATSLNMSQKGLVAVSHGSVVEIWKDHSKSKQKEPYMKHHFKNNQTKTKSLKFVPFEDFLGIGTNTGYSSIVVPGAGEANFDTFENNPFQTSKQRQTSEIKMLLEKIPAEMISLEPNNINRSDPRSRAIIEKERKEEIKQKADEIAKSQKKKMKMRLANKEKHEQILKDFNKNQQIRNKMRAIMEIKTEKKNKEKEEIKNNVKVIKMLSDDFDPELYIKEREEHEDKNMQDDFSD
jgi:U3 small nucleolar RNA-associated protein 7